MIFSTSVALALYATAKLASASPAQYVLSNNDVEVSQFGFYDWCIASKAAFLESFKSGGTDQWTLVMGNEAAGSCRSEPHVKNDELNLLTDTDSMVSALGMAYHLSHRKHDPQKAVSLLHVDSKALSFRPENVLIMRNAGLQDPTKELLSVSQCYGVNTKPRN